MNKKHSLTMMALAASLVLVLAMGTGCAKKGKKINPVTPPPAAEKTTGTGQPDIDVTAQEWSPFAELQTVYFAFDSYSLNADTLSKLEKNADVIKSTANVLVRVEGNCDERGTQEYNMALGEKRANAVRDQLIKLGVSGDRMVTVSFGEEKPVNPGHDESAWSKNRRCDFSKSPKK